MSVSPCVPFSPPAPPIFLFFMTVLFRWCVAPPRLQNSSSSASSEASETCQSVSECSSPTSVSSGSTMGAWASTEKVTGWGPSLSPIPCQLLPAQPQEPGNSKSPPSVAPLGARGRDRTEGFFQNGCLALSNDPAVVQRERKGYGELRGVKASSQDMDGHPSSPLPLPCTPPTMASSPPCPWM